MAAVQDEIWVVSSILIYALYLLLLIYHGFLGCFRLQSIEYVQWNSRIMHTLEGTSILSIVHCSEVAEVEMYVQYCYR